MAKSALHTVPDAADAKAGGANRIGTRVIPAVNWTLTCGRGRPIGGRAHASSVPPGEDGRKAENHGNWQVPAQAAADRGLIGGCTLNLTRACCPSSPGKPGFPDLKKIGTRAQVSRGCRQFVP